MSLRLLSLNARGLRDTLKRRKIFNYYRTRADFVCLQETHSCEKDTIIWESEWGGNILFSHGETNSRGICVLMPKGSVEGITNIYRDLNGRILKFDITWKNEIYSICTIYAPNKDSPAFFEKIREVLTQSDGYIIVIGDFNLVMDVNRDRVGSTQNNENSLKVVKDVCDEFMLSEIWRAKNNESCYFSWYRSRPKLRASRIDYAIISQGLNDCCENCGYINGLHSDHLAYYLYLNVNHNERGRGYWKMNTMYITNQNYIQRINETLDEIERSCLTKTKKEAWEYTKFKIKETSMNYAKNRASEIELIISQLSEKICEMEADLTSVNMDILERSKTDLESFMTEKIKACMFRSKANFNEFGEKPSKYYINLEKSRYNARTCNSLYNDSGVLITDTVGILKIQENFYKKLYSRNKEIVFDLDNTYDVQVTEQYAEENEKTFTIEELGIAVKQLPNGKTCGCDGIPIEFYKLFWARLKETLYGVVCEAYEDECLHNSALLGIVNLIPKANKDTRKLQFLRPITLLNSDYKAIEKMIANRIEPSLDMIISDNQRGFRKGRRISCNIRMAFELIKFAKDKDLEAIILSLDFEKCFDKVSFSILFGALEFFKFPKYITKWVKILYTNFKINTQNNGFFSGRIDIQQGLHQGGPCSSLLFLICAEILALMIKENKNIKGIWVDEIHNLFGQYADDADAYLLYKKETIDTMFMVLEIFRAMSGFTLNYNKTTIMRIGSMQNQLQHKNGL